MLAHALKEFLQDIDDNAEIQIYDTEGEWVDLDSARLRAAKFDQPER